VSRTLRRTRPLGRAGASGDALGTGHRDRDRSPVRVRAVRRPDRRV